MVVLRVVGAWFALVLFGSLNQSQVADIRAVAWLRLVFGSLSFQDTKGVGRLRDHEGGDLGCTPIGPIVAGFGAAEDSIYF